MIQYSYEEAVSEILDIPKFSSKNTMQDTREFYHYLGKPGNGSKMIHVAGTNGKGSVCSYLSQILLENTRKVGMFTSPHLVDMTERIQIGGTEVTREKFAGIYGKLMEKLQTFLELAQEGANYYPSFFETLFFMAMLLFEEEQTEYIILETGLGGRLDATNIIEGAVATVITSIDMDHMEHLGNTLEAITFEKAGIIKENVPVIYWSESEVVAEIIEKQADDKRCIKVPVSRKDIKNFKRVNKNIDFSFHSRYYDYVRVILSTGAFYQMENALLAIRTIETIDSHRNITLSQLQNALYKARWQGRMEEVAENVFVDGAHNDAGVEAFLECVRKDVYETKILLFAVMRDKDYESMIQKICKDNLFTEINITTVQGERAVKPKELSEIFGKYTKAKIREFSSIEEAFAECCTNRCHKAEQSLSVYIIGSLYLIGEIKDIIRRHQND